MAGVQAIASSHKFNEATKTINNIVDEANRQGITLTKEELDKLREMRILITILADREVFDTVSEEVYNEIRKQEGVIPWVK